MERDDDDDDDDDDGDGDDDGDQIAAPKKKVSFFQMTISPLGHGQGKITISLMTNLARFGS